MTYKYYLDTEHNCMFTQHYGEVNFDQLWEQVLEYISFPGYVAGMNLLRDFSQATIAPIYDLPAIKKVIEERPKQVDEILGNNRKVAWVLGNAKDFKIFHQYSAITRLNHAVINRQPFRKLNDALKWFGLPEDYDIPYVDR